MIVSRMWSTSYSISRKHPGKESDFTWNLIDEFIDESCEILSNLLDDIGIFLVFQIQITQCTLKIFMIDLIRRSLFHFGLVRITRNKSIERSRRMLVVSYQYWNTSRSANNSKIRIKRNRIQSRFLIRRTFSCFTSMASLICADKSSNKSLKFARWKSWKQRRFSHILECFRICSAKTTNDNFSHIACFTTE